MAGRQKFKKLIKQTNKRWQMRLTLKLMSSVRGASAYRGDTNGLTEIPAEKSNVSILSSICFDIFFVGKSKINDEQIHLNANQSGVG